MPYWMLPTQFCNSMFCTLENHWVEMQIKDHLYKFVCRNLAPCYLDLLVEYHIGSLEHHKHWFCANDTNRCIDGTKWKFAIIRPIVRTIWPIQEGINLTQNEVTTRRIKVFIGPPIYVKTMLKIYLAPNLIVWTIPMCMRWIAIVLWGRLMQVVSLQLMVARRWDVL
jgi:hypothetical protein